MTGTVPKGDMPILFGRLPIPARTQVKTGYLARPDQRGAFPTVVLVPPARGLTSSVRSRCRSLARYGLAVLAVDLYRGDEKAMKADPLAAIAAVSDRRGLGDLMDALRFLRAPQTSWSDPDLIGMLGIGHGGRFAVLASGEGGGAATAICYTPLRGTVQPAVLDLLAVVEVPLLGIYGRQDQVAGVADLDAARHRLPDARWLVYQDAGHDFLDEDADTYDASAAGDAQRRLVAFFLEELARPTPLEAAS